MWYKILRSLSAKKKLELNDVHSRLNLTQVSRLLKPSSTRAICHIVREAKATNQCISISGERHSMGGQQFARGALHLDMRRMNKVLSFDRERGLIEVEAGITWPSLIDYLLKAQADSFAQWGINQKQTGADKLSLGGAASSNIHGRGVALKPFVQDIESLKIVDANGDIVDVDRRTTPELFSLVIGGYGLFGVITSLTLRLVPRRKIERIVEVISLEALPDKARQRISDGFLYGDFQYKTDSSAGDFMNVGVFSCYRPISDQAHVAQDQKKLSSRQWNKLLHLAHRKKALAFQQYADYYLKTSGQIYWSDTHQLGYYNKNYVEYLSGIDESLKDSTLMITEIYAPREKLVAFTQTLAHDALRHSFDIIYGTMRLIERDDETFLPWAKERYACIIFNLRVQHSEKGIAKARHDFQLLIERALEVGGSYFLTYHRWARKDQILRAYPQFGEFLRLKLKYDPAEVFQSEWYKHHKEMFSLA